MFRQRPLINAASLAKNVWQNFPVLQLLRILQLLYANRIV